MKITLKSWDVLLFLFILGSLYIIAVFADFFAPYHYDEEQRRNIYKPPDRIRFFDEKKDFHLRPFFYEQKRAKSEMAQRLYEKEKDHPVNLRFFVNGFPYKILGIFSSDIHLFGTDSTPFNLLGTDSRGRDLWSRICYGSRVSLSIGLIGALISFVLGMAFGSIAGYYGKSIDFFIMRFCEMIWMFPMFYLMLTLRAAIPPEISSVKMYFIIVFIMSFIGWAGMARVIRGMVLSLKEQEYVTAARAMGATDLKVIALYILPNTLSYAIVYVTISIPGYIIGESTLSMLGLGIQDPGVSWGNLLADAMAISQITLYPWILSSGFFIFLTVLAYNFLGDRLRDATDAKIRNENRA
ncbi:MAG: ABC transporter permease [Candidatus Aureabacteria bacterium]|nr:ABC transporter permease [Candidatus Auribacterota bacterium]